MPFFFFFICPMLQVLQDLSLFFSVANCDKCATGLKKIAKKVLTNSRNILYYIVPFTAVWQHLPSFAVETKLY